MKIPVLILSGTIGAGKSAVLGEIHAILRERGAPHACVDLDAFTDCWPETSPFNQELALANLAAVWRNFAAAGAERLAVARVVESAEELDGYRAAIPGAEIAVVRLAASEATRLDRIRTREVGAGLEWHLRRSTELEAILDASDVEALVVPNEGALRTVASRVLSAVGWIAENP